jgi:hypothetical protein
MMATDARASRADGGIQMRYNTIAIAFTALLGLFWLPPDAAAAGNAWGQLSWGDTPEKVMREVASSHPGSNEPRGSGPNAAHQLVAVDYFPLFDGYFAIKFYFRGNALSYIVFLPELQAGQDINELYNEVFLAVLGRFGPGAPLSAERMGKVASELAFGDGGTFARLTRYRDPPQFMLVYGGANAGGL